MAELVLAPVITKIIELIYEYSKDQVRWQRGMKKELEKLLNILPKIQAVVSSYSQVEIKDDALNKWYWQLRDAIDEADDVIDEIEYRKASKNKKTGKVGFRMKFIKKRVVEISKRALKIDPYLNRLEMAVQKLNEISSWASIFNHLVDSTKQEQKQQQLELHVTLETGSKMLGDDFVGRSNEITRVKDWLSKPLQAQVTDPDDSYSNISLLSVVGHGGMGKTALLQQVYKDVILNKDGATEGFDVKIWVCVSTNTDAATVIKNILESLKKGRPNLQTLEELQNDLKSELKSPIQSRLNNKNKSKRFLLVLDDIWEADETCWRNVIVPLKAGSLGSKILITTRTNRVASMFEKIIKQDNENVPLKSLEQEELLELFNMHAFAGVENPDDEFKGIAKKMVEKLLGCPLAVKLIGNILNSHMDKSFWRNVLDTNIRNIKPVESGQMDLLAILKLSYMHLPDYLQNCFSFCGIFPQDYEFHKDDLVRMWIALGYIQSSKVSRETLEDTGRRYFDFLVQSSFFDKFQTSDKKECYKMHDLLHELANSISAQESLSIVGDKDLKILSKTVRHLSIDTRSPEEAFKLMEKFKNLRSLFLSFDRSDNLTDVLSKIFMSSKSIRLLVISAPDRLEIPEKICCLIHLRYLEVKCGLGAVKPPTSISNLYHLQFEIYHNFVMDNIGWEELKPNKNCHLIMDEVVIEDLSVLQMEQVREALRSTSYLRFLVITNDHNLVSFPSETESWFPKHSSTLTRLEFKELQSLESLPSLSTFSSLTYLRLETIPLLKSLPDLPSSLICLELIDLKSLQCLSSLPAISSLETLELSDIPLLKSLPDLPSSSLKKLKLFNLKSLQCLPSSLSAISSLKTLELHHIPLLNSLSDLPSSLESLILLHLVDLVCLPSCLPTRLHELRIKNVPRLRELPYLPASEVLDIEDCDPQLLERNETFILERRSNIE